MQTVEKLWRPLLGEMVWGVARGHGSFLHMQFGPPHLSVREPIVPREAQPVKVRRALLRRRVFLKGGRTLWVQYGDWHLRTADGELDSSASGDATADECLRDLDGQRLLSVEAGPRPNGSVFKFDLGGVLEVWPSSDIPDVQWTLTSRDGAAVSMRHDGSLHAEAKLA